ncbi:hypothetical protein RCL1_007345 [Eukaryota sp. TZLM3-RCL]
MVNFVGSQTEKNLITHCVHETFAAQLYENFGKAAAKEGHNVIAKIFSETAAMERQHANQFYSFLQGGDVTIHSSFPAGVPGTARVGNTIQNLESAIQGETGEFNVSYPEAARIALSEGFSEVAERYTAIAAAERFHAIRFQHYLDKLKNNSMYSSPDVQIWVCTNCGHIHEGTEAPDTCPACVHPKGYFEADTRFMK